MTQITSSFSLREGMLHSTLKITQQIAPQDVAAFVAGLPEHQREQVLDLVENFAALPQTLHGGGALAPLTRSKGSSKKRPQREHTRNFAKWEEVLGQLSREESKARKDSQTVERERRLAARRARDEEMALVERSDDRSNDFQTRPLKRQHLLSTGDQELPMDESLGLEERSLQEIVTLKLEPPSSDPPLNDKTPEIEEPPLESPSLIEKTPEIEEPPVFSPLDRPDGSEKSPKDPEIEEPTFCSSHDTTPNADHQDSTTPEFAPMDASETTSPTHSCATPSAETSRAMALERVRTVVALHHDTVSQVQNGAPSPLVCFEQSEANLHKPSPRSNLHVRFRRSNEDLAQSKPPSVIPRQNPNLEPGNPSPPRPTALKKSPPSAAFLKNCEKIEREDNFDGSVLFVFIVCKIQIPFFPPQNTAVLGEQDCVGESGEYTAVVSARLDSNKANEQPYQTHLFFAWPEKLLRCEFLNHHSMPWATFQKLKATPERVSGHAEGTRLLLQCPAPGAKAANVALVLDFENHPQIELLVRFFRSAVGAANYKFIPQTLKTL